MQALLWEREQEFRLLTLMYQLVKGNRWQKHQFFQIQI